MALDYIDSFMEGMRQPVAGGRWAASIFKGDFRQWEHLLRIGDENCEPLFAQQTAILRVRGATSSADRPLGSRS